MMALDKLEMVAKANAVGQHHTGDFRQVRQIIDKHDLAVAVWADAQEPDGVGFQIVKGQHLLEDIVATGKTRELAWTAIPCVCVEQAIALRQVIGQSDLH